MTMLVATQQLQLLRSMERVFFVELLMLAVLLPRIFSYTKPLLSGFIFMTPMIYSSLTSPLLPICG